MKVGCRYPAVICDGKPFITEIWVFTFLGGKAFENVVGRGGNAGNRYFGS